MKPCRLLQVRKGQPDEAKGFRVVLHFGAASELAYQKHRRQQPWLLGHLIAAVPIAPCIAGELAQFGMIGEAGEQIVPRDELRLASQYPLSFHDFFGKHISVLAEDCEFGFNLFSRQRIWSDILLNAMVQERARQAALSFLLKFCRESRGPLPAVGKSESATSATWQTAPRIGLRQPLNQIRQASAHQERWTEAGLGETRLVCIRAAKSFCLRVEDGDGHRTGALGRSVVKERAVIEAQVSIAAVATPRRDDNTGSYARFASLRRFAVLIVEGFGVDSEIIPILSTKLSEFRQRTINHRRH